MKFDNKKQQYRVNEQIRVREVRIVGDDIESTVIPTSKAIQLAEEKGVDLVEISPNAVPPVCRLIDYSKFLYQLKKKAKDMKAKQVKVEVKEIRFGPQTADADYNFKLKHAQEFINDGNKVKAYVFFKGRSILFKEQGEVLLLRFANDLEEIAKVSRFRAKEGKVRYKDGLAHGHGLHKLERRDEPADHIRPAGQADYVPGLQPLDGFLWGDPAEKNDRVQKPKRACKGFEARACCAIAHDFKARGTSHELQGMEQNVQPLVSDKASSVAQDRVSMALFRPFFHGESFRIYTIGQKDKALCLYLPVFLGVPCKLFGYDKDPVRVPRDKSFQIQAKLQIVGAPVIRIICQAAQFPKPPYFVLKGDAKALCDDEGRQGVYVV